MGGHGVHGHNRPVVAIPLGSIGDYEFSVHATPGVHGVDHQIVVGLVYDIDLAIAVEHIELAKTGADNVAEELHIAAFDPHTGQFDPVRIGIVARNKVIVLDQPVIGAGVQSL